MGGGVGGAWVRQGSLCAILLGGRAGGGGFF